MAEQAHAFLRPAGEFEGAETMVLAVVSGQGLAEIFQSLGATTILSGGPGLTPSLDRLRGALEEMAWPNVLLLPNSEPILSAAQPLESLARPQVRLAPSRTIPQGIAAMLAFNQRASLDDNLRRMSEAMERVVTLELIRTGAEASLHEWIIQVGDAPGLCNNDLYNHGLTAPEVALAALARLEIQAYEVLTLYSGEAISPEEVETLRQAFSVTYPSLQVEHYQGGQPGAHYIISLE
jgi:dihydroxyacetone kinase-like predicted kinase